MLYKKERLFATLYSLVIGILIGYLISWISIFYIIDILCFMLIGFCYSYRGLLNKHTKAYIEPKVVGIVSTWLIMLTIVISYSIFAVIDALNRIDGIYSFLSIFFGSMPFTLLYGAIFAFFLTPIGMLVSWLAAKGYHQMRHSAETTDQ